MAGGDLVVEVHLLLPSVRTDRLRLDPLGAGGVGTGVQDADPVGLERARPVLKLVRLNPHQGTAAELGTRDVVPELRVRIRERGDPRAGVLRLEVAVVGPDHLEEIRRLLRDEVGPGGETQAGQGLLAGLVVPAEGFRDIPLLGALGLIVVPFGRPDVAVKVGTAGDETGAHGHQQRKHAHEVLLKTG